MRRIKVRLDNIIYALQKFGGITTYWNELEQGLERASDIDLSVGYARNLFRLERYFSPVRLSGEPTIFHSSYYRYAGGNGARNVITVYDLIYEKYRTGPALKVHALQKRMALKNAHRVICISENTRKDLLELYRGHIDPARTLTIHLGVDARFRAQPESERPLEEPYLLFVGGRSGYKNFRIFRPLLRSGMLHRTGLKVLCVGAPFTAEERSWIRAHKGDFIFPEPRAPNAGDINRYYNHAHALIYPSLYEGFGLPVLEAQAAGCPVICSNTSSLPEIAGGAALFFSDSGILNDMPCDELIEAVSRLQDTSFRADLIERGRTNAAVFTWERTLRETIAVYKDLLAESPVADTEY